ncbi:MAG: hypothetical protein LBL47_00180, partial [Lactobacillus sp.]|nr:hypothetical protein [Lactobacillus sp.]
MKISKVKTIFLILLGALMLSAPDCAFAQTTLTDAWAQNMLEQGNLTKVDASTVNNKKKEINDKIKEAEENSKIARKAISEEYSQKLSELGVKASYQSSGGGMYGGGQYYEVYRNEDGTNLDSETLAKVQQLKDEEKAAKQASEEAFNKEKEDLKEQLKTIKKVDDDDDVYVYTDENGKETYFKYDGKTLETVSGVTKGCTPLPAKLAELESCIFCPLFEVIYDAAQTMATNSYTVLSTALRSVLLIGFAIFIAFKVLGHVSSFTKQDGPKFITELLFQAFKVLIAFYMLVSSKTVYSYIVGPVLDAGLDFGTAMLFNVDAKVLSCNANTSSGELGVLPAYLYQKLLCFITAVQQEIAYPQSIASTLVCVAMNAGKVDIGPIPNIFPDIEMLLQGTIIYVFTWLIMLSFAFYLIDATVRIGIVGALIPLLIACWPFKVTRKYTSTGWNMFLNTFFTYA